MQVMESLVESRFDTVLVNPPRRGLSPELVNAIVRVAPEHIFYSSCNPETFARDVAAMRGSYRLGRIALFDMFPLTEHCEVLGLLTRA